jgi:uncharacterized protein (TIGR02996 family)
MSREELLQAVLDAPLDDTPRMVLADWYMQAGDPRGELIVAQCQLTGRGLSPAARKEREMRVERALGEHESTWAAPARQIASQWRFRRGFIDKITGSADRVLEGWEALWAVEPVMELELTDVDAGAAARLAGSPLLGRIKHLTLRGEIGDEGAAALAASPLVSGLERLNLKDNDITDQGAMCLARAGLEHCKRLALTGNPVADEGAAALAHSPDLAGLEALFLSRTAITDQGVAALASSPHLGNLIILSLGTLEELTDQGARALLKSTALRSLRRLEVDVCYEISSKMLRALRKRWPALRG